VDLAERVDTDSNIQIINLKGGLCERPLERSKAADPALKLGPKSWVGREPNANAIVNISLVDGEALFEADGHGQLVDSVVEHCVYHSWRRAHRGDAQLVPKCVPKLKDVGAHYELQGRNKGFGREVFGKFVCVEKVCNDFEGVIGIDICIHTDRVTGE
jgi:hypothetical protein